MPALHYVTLFLFRPSTGLLQSNWPTTTNDEVDLLVDYVRANVGGPEDGGALFAFGVTSRPGDVRPLHGVDGRLCGVVVRR